MKSIIYTRWDGRQTPFTLKRRDIIKAFMDTVMEGIDPTMALTQMLWEGFPLAGMDFKVMGLSELLQQLRERKKELFSRYNLFRAFDQPRDDLQSLLQQEAQTRKEHRLAPSPRFGDLPPGLLEKIRSLSDFHFENDESRESFSSWKEREEEIGDLLEFYADWASHFRGNTFLDFDQALELMRQVKSLEEMAGKIESGQWTQIDPQALGQLLGDEASRSLAILLTVPGELYQEGLLRFSRRGVDLTPRGIRTIGEMAFGDLYHLVKRDRPGSSRGNAPRSGEIEPDSSRPYAFGDRFDLDISRSLLQSVARNPHQASLLQLLPGDFFVREREQQIASTIVMLLDLSWSMSWQGRFKAAKKVSLALDYYIRTHFPRDRFHVVGFSTEARELKAKELALAVWDRGYAFTNLQAGIKKATRLIERSGTRNNRIIVLTDGQPTAYCDGTQTRVEFPATMFGLSPNACKATLKEVKRATARGITIDTFMLDSNPVLVEFIREVSRISGGRAVLCRPGELGALILVEEVRRRGRR